MLLSFDLSWIAAALLEIIMLLFDTPAYGLAIAAIAIFNGIARMDFFSTNAGMMIYTDITTRIYGIIGIIMTFFFTYQLIMLVINPDGKSSASSDLIKKLITSLIMVAFFPTLYHYMAVFQEHVLTEGTIMGIVTGTASGGDSDSMGRNTAMIVYLSMFHPVNGGYQSIVDSSKMDEDGNVVLKSASECVADTEKTASTKTCELWIDAVNNFVQKKHEGFLGGITAFTLNYDLIRTVFKDDGSEYMIFMEFVCGLVLAWFYISYAIDLGYRVVKLGFLEIISPAPLIMRIFPQTRKTYDNWKSQMLKTYVEIFVRVAIVAFVIVIITKIPVIVGGLFGTLFQSRAYIGFAIIAMIFGIMKFGKELPNLVKDMFSTGSGFLSGINWKPGVGKRLKAGKDELVGYGKKAVTWAGSKAIRGAAMASGIHKTVRGIRGGIEGAKMAMNAFKKANVGSSGIPDKVGKATAAAKGFSAAMKANKNISTKTPWGQAIKLLGNVGGNVGGTVKASSLGEILSSGVDKLLNAGTIDAANLAVNTIRTDTNGIVNGFNDTTGVTDRISKLTTLQQETEQQYFRNGGKPLKGYAYNSKGEVIGEGENGITFNSHDDIVKYFKGLKDQAQTDIYTQKMANGMTNQGFDKVVAALTGQGAKALGGLSEIDIDQDQLKQYGKKLSEGMGTQTIDAINSFLGEEKYKPELTLGAIKRTNDAITEENLRILDKQKELESKRDILEREIAAAPSEPDRDAIERELLQGENGGFYSTYQDDLAKKVDELIEAQKQDLENKKAELESTRAAITAGNTKMAENSAKYISEDKAVNVDLGDLQAFLQDYARNASSIKTDDDHIAESAELLKQLHELTKAIGSNTDVIRAMDVPKAEKKDDSEAKE